MAQVQSHLDDNRVALITGANTIGRVTARELAKQGVHLFVACRSAARTQALLDELRAVAPGAKVEWLALGLELVLAAKLIGTALAARLFQLTQPALLQIKWFARLYTPLENLERPRFGPSAQLVALAHGPPAQSACERAYEDLAHSHPGSFKSCRLVNWAPALLSPRTKKHTLRH